MPITGADRVRVTESTRTAWLIVYLASGVVAPEEAAAVVRHLVEETGVARIAATGATAAA